MTDERSFWLTALVATSIWAASETWRDHKQTVRIDAQQDAIIALLDDDMCCTITSPSVDQCKKEWAKVSDAFAVWEKVK